MADELTKDFTRRIATLEQEKDSNFFSRPRVEEEHWRSAVSNTLNLPGIRGLWSMAAVGSAGQAIDAQGLGNHLARNNDADFGYDNLVPYCDYNGVNEFHSIGDIAAFDIFGTEAYVDGAFQGLTIGGWFQFDDNPPAAVEALIAKWSVGVDRAYILRRLVATTIQFSVNDGVAVTSATSAVTGAATWYHCVGRFDTTTGDVFVYLNGVETTTIAAVAAIVDSATSFTIAASGTPDRYLDGRASLCWVCVESLSADIIMGHYQNTRAAYGVII